MYCRLFLGFRYLPEIQVWFPSNLKTTLQLKLMVLPAIYWWVFMWVIQLFWVSPWLDGYYRWQEGRSGDGGRSQCHLWRTQCTACHSDGVWNFRFRASLRSDSRIFASTTCFDQFLLCTACAVLSHLPNTLWIVSFIRSWELVSLIFFKFLLPRLDEWMPLLSFFSLLLNWLLCQPWRILLFSSNAFSFPF